MAVLTDGGQDPGLAVLINSLIRNGFDGTLWVGWRDGGSQLFGQLPEAVHRATNLRLIELTTRRPLAYYKPNFLEQVWDLVGNDAVSVIFMDCDLVVGCEWGYIKAWTSMGLALAEDLPGRVVGPEHPLRGAWEAVMRAAGIPTMRKLGSYYNSGFVGVPAAARELLTLWSSLGADLEAMPGMRSGSEMHFVRGVRGNVCRLDLSDDVRTIMRPYFLEDQDAFNMALMGTDAPINAMGPDAMGFTGTRTAIIPHALGPHKPWDKHYLRQVILHGEGPSFADDTWWAYSEHPINVHKLVPLWWRRLTWRLAKVLRRLL